MKRKYTGEYKTYYGQRLQKVNYGTKKTLFHVQLYSENPNTGSVLETSRVMPKDKKVFISKKSAEKYRDKLLCDPSYKTSYATSVGIVSKYNPNSKKHELVSVKRKMGTNSNSKNHYGKSEYIFKCLHE